MHLVFDICLVAFSEMVPTLPPSLCPEHHQNCPGDGNIPVPGGIQVKAEHSRGRGMLQRGLDDLVSRLRV